MNQSMNHALMLYMRKKSMVTATKSKMKGKKITIKRKTSSGREKRTGNEEKTANKETWNWKTETRGATQIRLLLKHNEAKGSW